MNAERIARRLERLERINDSLKDTGYRVYHQPSNLNGRKSKRPYKLHLSSENKMVGSYEMPENAHEKAIRLIEMAK